MDLRAGQWFEKAEEVVALLNEGEAVVAVRVTIGSIKVYGPIKIYGDIHCFLDYNGCYDLHCNWVGAGVIHGDDRRVLLHKGTFNPICKGVKTSRCNYVGVLPGKCFE